MLNSSNVQKGIIKSTSNHTKGTIVKSNSTLNSVCSLSMQSFISWNHLSHLSFRTSFFLLSSSLLYPPPLCKYMYVCVCSFSHAWLFVIPWTIAHQTPLSMEFSRQGYWSGSAISFFSSWLRDQTGAFCISFPGRHILSHQCHLGSTHISFTHIACFTYICTLFHINNYFTMYFVLFI